MLRVAYSGLFTNSQDMKIGRSGVIISVTRTSGSCPFSIIGTSGCPSSWLLIGKSHVLHQAYEDLLQRTAPAIVRGDAAPQSSGSCWIIIHVLIDRRQKNCHEKDLRRTHSTVTVSSGHSRICGASRIQCQFSMLRINVLLPPLGNTKTLSAPCS